MSRLFTFGCSFTQWVHPTWADILGKEFDFYENWGRACAGNFFISQSVSEASIRRNFTSNDTIAIMWTSCFREDRYLDTGWRHFINHIFKSYPEISSERGFFIRDMYHIHMTKTFLDHIGCKYYMMSMMNFCVTHPNGRIVKNSKIKDVLELYSETISIIKPSVHEIIFNSDWYNKPSGSSKKNLIRDFHPTPIEHLEYIQKVLPEISLKPSTIEWAEKSNDKVLENFNCIFHQKFIEESWLGSKQQLPSDRF